MILREPQDEAFAAMIEVTALIIAFVIVWLLGYLRGRYDVKRHIR
jgi:hypothetical protein